MFGPPQPVPRTGHRSAVPSERAAHRSVRLPGSRPNGGPADGPSGQGKPPALVGQTPTRSPHSERKSRLSLLNSKFQVTRRFDATSVSEDPPPVSLGIRRSFRSGSNQNERTLQLKSLRRNFNLWLSLVPSSHQRPPAPPLGSSTVTSVPRVAAVTSDSDGGRGAMSPPAGDGRLSLSSVSSMSLDLSPTGTPTGIEAGPAAVHEDLLSASSSVSWLQLQRAEREANTVVLKRAVSGWRGKFQRRCIGLLIGNACILARSWLD